MRLCWPNESKRASGSGDRFWSGSELATGRVSFMAVALRRSWDRCQAPLHFRRRKRVNSTKLERVPDSEGTEAALALSVGDFLRKLAGVLDPARHQLLRGKKANQLSLPVGLGHRFSEPGRIAILQFLHGIDADLA